MKKYKFYIITIIIVMMIPVLYKAFLTHRNVSYKVDGYEIKESFQIKNHQHAYTFVIKKGKEEYSYTISENLHKKGKVIKKIQSIKQGDLECMIPTYKISLEKKIYCRKDKIQVSNEVLRDDKTFQKIIKKEKVTVPKESVTKQDYKNLVVYTNNIPHDQAIIIWDYKGIIILERNKNIYQQFLDYDLYDNVMATTNSRYFVLFENTSVNGIEKVHCYDLKKDKYKVIELEEKLDKNSYINGVVKDLIYITDTKSKKQYTLNVKKEELQEVGKEEEGYIVFEQEEKSTLSKSDFFSKKQFFMGENYTKDDKVCVDDCYIYQENNEFYRQIEGANKVKLLELENVVEWKNVDQELIILQDDSLYLYQEDSILKKIVEYNELKYNYQNIYYLWK